MHELRISAAFYRLRVKAVRIAYRALKKTFFIALFAFLERKRAQEAMRFDPETFMVWVLEKILWAIAVRGIVDA
jgi:hypothetical protein